MPPQYPQSPQTLTINNFGGYLTRYPNGDINSGFAKYSTSHSYDPFSQPKVLQFMETPTSIGGSVVTDLIVAGKCRLENSATYLYAIGHTGRLYKIQANDPNTKNVAYDNPVLVTTLSLGQTFLYGASITFYGSTQQVWIGWDKGVTRINFDGTGEAAVGDDTAGHWVDNVPRQVQEFNGKLYYTNSTNVAEINDTTINSYAKLSPGLPVNMQARDVDLTSNGTFLVVTASEIPLVSILNTGPDANLISNGGSMIAYWNGTDTGISQISTITSFAQTAYHTFGNQEFSFGYDISGGMVSNPLSKILTMVMNQSPLPNAIGSNGNIVGWFTPEFNNGFLVAALNLYGNLDNEYQAGLYRQLRMSSSLTNGDVLKIPFTSFITNFTFGGGTSGYTGDVIGLGKMYFSTLEYDGSTTSYKLYAFNEVPTGSGTTLTGVYETQTQLFSKKITVNEVRVYLEPAVTNNSFTVALIGIDGNTLTGGSQTFSIGTKMAVGDNVVKYNPTIGGTPALGVRITNVGSVTPKIHKIEIDYSNYGD